MKVYVLTNRASEVVGIFASWQGASEQARERAANVSEHDLEWTADDGVTPIVLTSGCVLELLTDGSPDPVLVHVEGFDIPGRSIRFSLL